MRLRRRVTSTSGAVSFPECAKLFGSSSQGKLDLLRRFLASGEVLEQCETYLTVSKEWEDGDSSEEELLTVAGMRAKGVSERLVCKVFLF